VPYSVKTSAGAVPISNFEPWNTPLGLVADYMQIMDHLDEPSAEQGAMAIAFTLMKGLADKTYWRSVDDLVDVASGLALGHEPTTKARDVFLRPVVTALTGGPLVAAVTRAIDPTVRETRTVLDLFISKVPGYSKTLPPATDGYGDPRLAPSAVGGAWTNLVNPITLKPVTEDRVKMEGARLGVRLPDFPWTIGGSARGGFDIRQPFPEDRLGVELTAAQRYDRISMYRDLIRSPQQGIEKTLLNLPEYQALPRAAQRDAFSQFLSKAWTVSGEHLQIKHPDIARKVIDSQANRIAPTLQEQDRPALEQQRQEAKDAFSSMSPEERDNLLRYGIYGDEDD
jgi:hypothetical protein